MHGQQNIEISGTCLIKSVQENKMWLEPDLNNNHFTHQPTYTDDSSCYLCCHRFLVTAQRCCYISLLSTVLNKVTILHWVFWLRERAISVSPCGPALLYLLRFRSVKVSRSHKYSDAMSAVLSAPTKHKRTSHCITF